MAHLGLSLEDYGHEVVEVWPDTWPAFELFYVLRTQWRVGAAGPTGLDYNVLYRKLDRMDLGAAEYSALEADVQAMEVAALEAMSEKD